MASEYLKWLARDVKPEEKRELTKKEKWQNWWYYHKWHLVIGALILLVVVGLIRDVAANKSNQPDYQVAYVGTGLLPDDTAAALESALAELGEDLNGDGQVLVRVNQYSTYSEEADYASVVSGATLLMADMSSNESFFYLMEDPEDFQATYPVLAYADGTLPEEGGEITGTLWYSWADYPVLTGLALGSYTQMYLTTEVTGDSQEFLSGLYIGRRGFADNASFEYMEGCTALWQKLIAGAE